MLATEFDFLAPTELAQALQALEAGGPSAKLLAGGMSLVPLMNLGAERPRTVVSIQRVDGLRHAAEDAHTIRIGALMTHAELSTDAVVRGGCAVLANTAGILADVQVRNRGTIGGSLAHAQPGADYLTLLSALDAEVDVRSLQGARAVKVRELVVGAHETVLAPAEMIVSVSVPKPSGNAAYVRYSRIQGTYPVVNAAALVHESGATVALGGALRRPVVLETDIRLDDPPGGEALAALAREAEEACEAAYDDHVATAEYRRAMAGVFARRAVQLALERPSAAIKH